MIFFLYFFKIAQDFTKLMNLILIKILRAITNRVKIVSRKFSLLYFMLQKFLLENLLIQKLTRYVLCFFLFEIASEKYLDLVVRLFDFFFNFKFYFPIKRIPIDPIKRIPIEVLIPMPENDVFERESERPLFIRGVRLYINFVSHRNETIRRYNKKRQFNKFNQLIALAKFAYRIYLSTQYQNQERVVELIKDPRVLFNIFNNKNFELVDKNNIFSPQNLNKEFFFYTIFNGAVYVFRFTYSW